MEKPRLLLVGDFACTTGFARVNECLMQRLKPEWQIYVCAINYHGDSHPLQREFHLYPADLNGEPFGVRRFMDLVRAIRPKVVVLANDAWNIHLYTDQLTFENVKVPVVPYIPVDAPNQTAAKDLNACAHVVTPTQFGLDQLRLGGYEGEGSVIPYGVDTSIYKPMDRTEARKALNFQPHMMDAFVVGRADRNAYRKRYDLSTQYWAEWWHDAGKPQDAFLYYHCSLRDNGWDLEQLCSYYGIGDQLILTSRDLAAGQGVTEEKLRQIYNTWDVHFSTTLGEGWGFVAHESAACGVAQLVPRYSAYGEWLDGHAVFMRVDGTLAMTNQVNTLGAITNKTDAKAALGELYRGYGKSYGQLALAAATRPDYNWNTIAQRFNAVLKGVVK